MPFRQYVVPGHAGLVINAYVTPQFKGGLRPVDALRAEVSRQGPTGAGRRAVSIQPAGRCMSHKLITYFDAAIPSCSGRSGARSAWAGAGSVPVPCGPPTGVFSACLLPVYRYLRRHVLRFTAAYAHLFYTKLLKTLVLLSFDPLFSNKWASVLQLSRRPAVAPARHRQGAGRPRDAQLEAVYCATNIRLTTMALSHILITYLEALIPSCPARRPLGRSGGSQAPAGVLYRLFMRIYVPIVRYWPRFTAVYAHLFYTKSLNSLGLRVFVPFFRSCGNAAAALPHGIDKA